MREEKEMDEYEHDSSDEEVRGVHLNPPPGFSVVPVGFSAALSSCSHWLSDIGSESL